MSLAKIAKTPRSEKQNQRKFFIFRIVNLFFFLGVLAILARDISGSGAGARAV